LVLSPSSWLNGTGPGRLFSYRSSTADFNHDGFDDFVAATGGIHTTHATGAITQIFEPIPLALSSADGRLFDATTYVAGQESGGFEPELRSAHNLAIGDVNGDGHKDFFQANFLFVNDGTGHFAARQDLLPPEASSLAKRIMSSASADGADHRLDTDRLKTGARDLDDWTMTAWRISSLPISMGNTVPRAADTFS